MIDNRVSIVIPSNKEIFLRQTILDLLKNARGDIEIIPILDGYYPPAEEIVDDPRVKYLHRGEVRGMRNGITSGAGIATGEYLMKIDAHCMVDEGFDEKLKEVHQDNWVQIPRRKRLDAENWCIQDVGKADIDYEFLSYPYWKPHEVGMHGTVWNERARDNKDKMLDENMSFQGSCWFMKRDYFDFLELMDEENYGTFANEAQEIGLKCQVSGGKVMTNKNTWYAHLHKGKKYGRGYFISKNTFEVARDYTLNWLTNTAWNSPKAILKFEDIIEHFWPIPTWPDNWKEEIAKYGKNPKETE